MKNPLSDLYEQVLLNEAEKHALQNPSQDEIGNLKTKGDLFGSKPKPVEGAEKAKIKEGPSYKETTGGDSKPKAEKSSMPNSSAAKSPKTEEGKEMKDTEVDPTKSKDKDEEDEKKEKKNVKAESFTMNSFENLFKKTLMQEEMYPEENQTLEDPTLEGEGNELEAEETEAEEEEEEDLEEEEGDLISDLRELQDKLGSILSKLEDIQSEEEEEESEEYSEEDFDTEFEDEEAPVKESVDKPKALNTSKGKTLMAKKNKIGKVNPKGGKAHTGNVKDDPSPKALGDKKTAFQKGKPEVKSTIKKGDFIK